MHCCRCSPATLILIIFWGIGFILRRAITLISIYSNLQKSSMTYFGENEGPGLVGLHPWPGLCIAGLVGEYLGDVGLNLGLVGE